MYQHPQSAAQMVEQHQAELHALRARTGRAGRDRPDQPRGLRHRAGWALVWIGLRLAYAAGED